MAPLLFKNTKIYRDQIQNNGFFVPNNAYYVNSGTFSMSGTQTGSQTIMVDCLGLKISRVEVFHSGSAQYFDLKLENSTPNSGTEYDPRNIVVCYDGIPGSSDYTGGLDQVENMVCLTDQTIGREGQLYLKFLPWDSGQNDFKYLLFFEGAYLYINYRP